MADQVEVGWMDVDHQEVTLPQVVLPFLPGYMFDGRRVVSTGAALPATQHISKETGEVFYYVRPFFCDRENVGLYVTHEGVVRAILEGLEH